MCQISFQLHLPIKFYGMGALSAPLPLERPKKPSINRVNRTTLKQLEAAAFLVQNRDKNTVLAKIFSNELKFTTDCLKNWFAKNHKI